MIYPFITRSQHLPISGLSDRYNDPVSSVRSLSFFCLISYAFARLYDSIKRTQFMALQLDSGNPIWYLTQAKGDLQTNIITKEVKKSEYYTTS